LQKAREIRDQADLLAASFIDRFRWSVGRDGKPSTPAPTSDVAQQDYRAVVEAYRQVGEQYPNTEIAAYAMLRLSGFFQYRRENDLAIRTAEKVAEDYSRSHHENMAYFMAGMIELQSRHQPQAAIEWLKKIRRPSPPVVPENDTPRPPVDQETQLYIAAQQQIARAEQMIGKGTLAQARVEQLGQRYPHYADYAKERLAADQKAFLQSEFGIDLNTMFNDSVLATLELANVSGDAENPLVRLSATAEHSATNAPPTARTAVPTVPSTPSAIEHSSLGLWLGLGVCIIGVSLLGAGIYLHFLLRKEQQ
jgi:outer membrane protein assembly factor BamD (BamD/ComL family)